VGSLKGKRTKKGDKMAILTLEDQTGSVEVIIFPDVFTASSPLLKGDDPLLVQGTAEVEESSVKIISTEIASLEEVRQKAVRNVLIGLRGECLSRERLKEIRNLLFRYPGESSVLLRVEPDQGESVIVAAHPHLSVSPCRELIEEIEAITGVKVAYGNGEKDPNHRHPEGRELQRTSG